MDRKWALIYALAAIGLTAKPIGIIDELTQELQEIYDEERRRRNERMDEERAARVALYD